MTKTPPNGSADDPTAVVAAAEPTSPPPPRALPTPDGRYVLIDGRRWRATNPHLPEETRKALVADLMRARRDVGRALKTKDEALEKDARARVHAAKVALGERGPKWWEADPPQPPEPASPGSTP